MEDLAVLSTVKMGPKNYLETAQHFFSGKKMETMANLSIPS
jgi:hypothetical protein